MPQRDELESYIDSSELVMQFSAADRPLPSTQLMLVPQQVTRTVTHMEATTVSGHSIRMSDVGGQPEFEELLPSLPYFITGFKLCSDF